MSGLIDIVFKNINLNKAERFFSSFDLSTYDLLKSNYTDDVDSYYNLKNLSLSTLMKKEKISGITYFDGVLKLSGVKVPHVYIYIYFDNDENIQYKEGRKCSIEFNINSNDIKWAKKREYCLREIKLWAKKTNNVLQAEEVYLELEEESHNISLE